MKRLIERSLRGALAVGAAWGGVAMAARAWAGPPACLPDSDGDGLPMYATYRVLVAPCTDELGEECGPTVAVALADLDHDGWVDMVGAVDGVLPTGFISVSRGLADGAFELPSQLLWPEAANVTDLQAADLDLDGDIDVVAVDRTGGLLHVYANNGAGVLSPAIQVEVKGGGGGGGGGLATPRSVVLADFDQNGAPDLLTHNTGTKNASLFLNASGPGAIGFGPEIVVPCVAHNGGWIGSGVHPGPHDAAADLNGDGWPDAAIVSQDAAGFGLQLLFNTGGMLEAGQTLIYPGGSKVHQAIALDLDDDGDADLATPSANGATLAIWFNNGGGAFAEPAIYDTSTPLGATNSRAIASGDVDGDGRPDLVVNFAAAFGHEVVVLRNLGEGVFGEKLVRALGGGPSSAGSGLRCLDLNGDGLDDVISLSQFGGDSGVLVGLSLPGSPVESAIVSDPEPGFNTPSWAVAAAQLDGIDGPDAVRVTDWSSVVYFAEGGVFKGLGTTYQYSPTTESSVKDAVLARFFSTDAFDIVATDQVQSWPPVPGVLQVLRSVGPGVYNQEPALPLGPVWPREVAASDLDGDGQDEVLARIAEYAASGTPPTYQRRLLVIGLDRSGVPTIRQDLLISAEVAGSTFGALTLGDIDGDNDPDAIATSTHDFVPESSTLRVFENDGGTLASVQSVQIPTRAFSAALADADGDGDMDIFVGHTPENDQISQPVWLSLLTNDGAGQFTLARQYESKVHAIFGRRLYARPGKLPGSVLLFSGSDNVMVVQHTMADGVRAVWTHTGGAVTDIAPLARPDGRFDLVSAEMLEGTIAVHRDRSCWSPPPSCPADCDANRELNIDDFICFQTLYAIGAMGVGGADCDNSGGLDIDDFICFQTFFAIGC